MNCRYSIHFCVHPEPPFFLCNLVTVCAISPSSLYHHTDRVTSDCYLWTDPRIFPDWDYTKLCTFGHSVKKVVKLQCDLVFLVFARCSTSQQLHRMRMLPLLSVYCRGCCSTADTLNTSVCIQNVCNLVPVCAISPCPSCLSSTTLLIDRTPMFVDEPEILSSLGD